MKWGTENYKIFKFIVVLQVGVFLPDLSFYGMLCKPCVHTSVSPPAVEKELELE